MEQNYSTTKTAGNGTNIPVGDGVNWNDVDGVTGVGPAAWLASGGAGGWQGDVLKVDQFGFELPDFAVVDGVSVSVDGFTFSINGYLSLSEGVGTISTGALPNVYGSATDLWGADAITPAQVNDSAFGISISGDDISGGDGQMNVSLVEITVYWHIEMTNTENDNVPTRFDYKVYSRDGVYLGLLPKVSSKFAFAQDINSAGSSIVVSCAKFVKNETTVEPLLTEAGDIITTENDLPILAETTETLVTTGDAVDDAIFKNSNRVKVWMYNRYYPNGKLMFSGQINRVEFKYGSSDPTVKLTIYSDGLDLNNFIARGYPFSYTNDQVQSTNNGFATAHVDGPKGAGWVIYGQSWTTGAAVTNIGAISVMLRGTANVTLSVYDGPNGNLLGSSTQAVSNGAAGVVQFEFPSLIDVAPNTPYFFAIWVDQGQSIDVYYFNPGPYAGGQAYESIYSGGSGGGSFTGGTSDLYFITKSGTPTTTTTYSSDDPVTDMAHGILLDYNLRGGYITERDFEATGLSLTYTFVVATILDALKKIIELSPTGFYSYIDLGTAEIDIKQMSDTADFTVVRGRHINELNLALSIEQVKNYLLFSGGPTAGVNLYRDYTDAESAAAYGIRTATKSDNRVTISATADAVGGSFIEENADERQETTLIVKDEHVDISLFVPGKTIGFKNFGNFIDDMVLQIVRREPNFSDGIAVLTLGRLPVRQSDEIQRLNRELLNEQTLDNPSAPS